MIRGWFSSCVIISFSFMLFFLFSQFTFLQTDQKRSFVELDPHEFYIQMNLTEDEVLIDVRTVKEFQKERLHHAILASNSNVLFSIADTLDLEQPIFIYCEDEARSITACTFLIERGFRNVYMLKEGINGWKRRNLEIDDSRIRRRNFKFVYTAVKNNSRGY